MSSGGAGSSSPADKAMPCDQAGPGSKLKPANYKALHYEASQKWRVEYRDGFGKVHIDVHVVVIAEEVWKDWVDREPFKVGQAEEMGSNIGLPVR